MNAVINVAVDPRLSPRAQLEPVLSAMSPIACSRHPHVLCPVDIGATIYDLLHPWEPYHGRCNFEWTFQSHYEHCNDCPNWRRFEAAEGCARYEGERSKAITLEPDISALPLYETWKGTLGPRVCRYRGREKLLLLLKTELAQPFQHYIGKVLYRPCMECALKRCGVTPLFTSCAFDNYKPPCATADACLAKCREFADQFPPRFLFLFGNTGTGKTHLAISILRQWLEREHPGNAWFVKFAELVSQQRATYGRHGSDDDDPSSLPLARAQTVKLLVLDELRQGGGRDEGPLLFDIISHRHEHFLPTVLTTNLTFESLEPELGSRVLDRIREAQFAALGFNWTSKRSEVNARYGQPR